MTREEFIKEVEVIQAELGFGDNLPEGFRTEVREEFSLDDVPDTYIVDGDCPFCSLFDPENKRIIFWVDKLQKQAEADSVYISDVDFWKEFAFMARHEMRHLWQWVNCREGYMIDKDRVYMNKVMEKDANAYAFKLHVPEADKLNVMLKEGYYEVNGRRV